MHNIIMVLLVKGEEEDWDWDVAHLNGNRVQYLSLSTNQTEMSLSSRMMGTSQQWLILANKTNKGRQASKIIILL